MTKTKRLNPEHVRYYAAHPEQWNGMSLRWRAAHPERAARKDAWWRTTRRGRLRVWRAKHRDVRRSDAHRRRTAGSREDARVILAMIRDIKRESCVYCGRVRKLTLDHQTPVARGGAHTPGNIVLACARCNSSKHDRPDLESWIRARWGVSGVRRLLDWQSRRYWWLEKFREGRR